MNIGLIAIGVILLVSGYLLLQLKKRSPEPDYEADDWWGRIIFCYSFGTPAVVALALTAGIVLIILGIVK